MRSQLPYLQSPVGNRVWSRFVPDDAEALGLDAQSGWRSFWYSSGTSALAAAISTACACKANKRPLIAVCAYGCPDLVSAIYFAGAEPLFVDVSHTGLGFDVAQLRAALSRTDSVVAIIGVDLFGLTEQWTELRHLATSSEALLIQDCAQSIQRISDWEQGLHGDFVVYSFGRGKPVYLQGGGALLANTCLPSKVLQQHSDQYATLGQAKQWYSAISAMMYNVVLEPHLYALLAMIMGDRLGDTRYKPLETIECAPQSFVRRANISIDRFWQEHRDQASAVMEIVGDLALTYSDQLCTPVNVKNGGRLLPNLTRFPIFVSAPFLRDRWLQRLLDEGIGATVMYGRSLPEIIPVALQREWPEYPNAKRLARQLLTLPVHSRLTQKDLITIYNTFKSCAKELS